MHDLLHCLPGAIIMIIDLFLYAITTLIWGSTWLAIHWQLGTVSPYWSVTYRFAIATVILFIYCGLTRKQMRFNLKQHCALFCQGALLFSVNYLLYYIGSQYFMSGLVAIAFASILIMNIINSRIFFKTPLKKPIIAGAILGLSGLIVVFSGQFSLLATGNQAHSSQLLLGLAICLAGTLMASFGNMVFVYNQRFNIPILQSNAYGILYGTIILAFIAISVHAPLSFDSQPRFWGALLYLAAFGTVLAFGTYLQLIQRIGAERAAYAFVMLPIISLLLSSVFEAFHWTLSTFIGLIMIILGNILVIMRKRKKSTTLPTTLEAG